MRYVVEDRAAAYENRAAPKKEPPPEVLTDNTSKKIMVTPKYVGLPVGELIYFPLRARGEALKFILHYAGLSYEMRTIQMSEWADLKPTMPKGQLPVFTPLCEEPMPESADIAKYIASVAPAELGLAPADGSAAEMFEVCNAPPLIKLNPLTNFVSAAEAAAQLPGVISESTAVLKGLGGKLTAKFFNGAKPHYGEFALLHIP